MIRRTFKTRGFLIVQWDPMEVWFDKNYVSRRIEKINTLVRNSSPTRPSIRNIGASYFSFSRITPKEPLESCDLSKALGLLGAQLDRCHSEGLIHGDIKYSNVLVSGGEISLIDWEPVLVYENGGGTFLRSTAPYIATRDIAANELTEATDRIAYYFLCERLLKGWWPLTRHDVVSVESRLVNTECREIFDMSCSSVAGRQ